MAHKPPSLFRFPRPIPKCALSHASAVPEPPCSQLACVQCACLAKPLSRLTCRSFVSVRLPGLPVHQRQRRLVRVPVLGAAAAHLRRPAAGQLLGELLFGGRLHPRARRHPLAAGALPQRPLLARSQRARAGPRL